MTTPSETIFNDVRKVLASHGPYHDHDVLMDVLCNLFANVLYAIPAKDRKREIARLTQALRETLDFMDATGGKAGVQ